MLEINIYTNVSSEIVSGEIDTSKLKKLVNAVCGEFAVEKGIINIQIVDDDSITALNRQYLDHNYTTDVISFNLSDDADIDGISFDIIVNAQLAERKSAQLNIPFMAELALYITHGLLHNFGYDDLDEESAEKMHKKEDEILSVLNYGIVYNSQGRAELDN